MNPRVLYRFTRDLRLEDHAGLAQAASIGEIVPVLVIDRLLESRLSRSPRRAAFFCGAVASLDEALRERGARLLVRRGTPSSVLKNVARACGAIGVAWSAAYDGEGAHGSERLQSDLEEAGLRATIVHDAPAVAPEETAAARGGGGTGYRAFAPYFDVWRTCELASYEAPLLLHFASTDLQSEPLPQPHDFGAPERTIESGASAARETLDRFLAESAMQYAVAANVPSDDRTSHLSAHLSFGTISARTIVRATRSRMDDPFLLAEEKASLRLFLRSIAMRDFFLQLGYFHPHVDEKPLQERMADFKLSRSHEALDAWRSGNTGYPLVDAGIRQLRETGWMHPHVRPVAASFLCFDLGVDWRVGRDEWDRWLIEDDLAIASGNWQWIAGVGADMAQFPRIYNPEKQRRRYDPTGAYVKHWIKELAYVPTTALRTSTDDQLTLPLFSSDSYPRPILDHEHAAHQFLSKYRAYVESREQM